MMGKPGAGAVVIKLNIYSLKLRNEKNLLNPDWNLFNDATRIWTVL